MRVAKKPVSFIVVIVVLLPIVFCDVDAWGCKHDSTKILDLVKESKIYKFLHDDDQKGYKGELEASGIAYVDGAFYIVFDNFKRIAKIDVSLNQNPGELFVNDEMPFDEVKGFEGMTHDRKGTLFMIAEHTGDDEEGLVVAIKQPFANSIGHEVKFEDFKLKKENKGFEGVAYLERDGKDYLLALCEGNNCKDDNSGKKGVIRVFKKENNKWVFDEDKEILLKNVGFEDYAGIDILNNEKVAIVSQQNSQLWVGKLNAQWMLDEEAIYDFPCQKNIECDGGIYQLTKSGLEDKEKITYGNVEGVAWISDERIAIVSDRRKKDKQELWHSCKDQSIHIFKLP